MAEEFDVVIGGGGIAGLTAGLTAARLGRRTLILTGDILGGQLLSIDRIEGFPGFPEGVPGYELCPMLQEQATSAGAEFMMISLDRLAAGDGKWRLATAEGEIVAGAVIFAIGSMLKKLGIPGEERLAGKGVSQCASCDGPLHRGQIVAVVGGGDSAMQEALTLAEFAAKVVILHRGDALMGQACYRDRITAHPKIEIRCNTIVTEVLGATNVSGLRTRDCNTGISSDLEAAALFAYVGLQPNSDVLAERIKFDSDGRIPVDAWMRTELTGLCAAGNVRSCSPCRAVSAAGDGADAAVAVDRYLADKTWRAD